jgi:hypothetical protein
MPRLAAILTVGLFTRGQVMNPWIYDVIKNLDEASEDELRGALDELEYLFDALDELDRDTAEQLIGKLTFRLEQLRGAS